MSPRLQALKYLLSKADTELTLLSHYIDDTCTLGMDDYRNVKALMSVAREILEEALLP